MNEEHKKKISKALKGRKLSPEHILKLSLSKKGRKAWNKGLKTGISFWKGKKRGKCSEETKEKMSLSHKGINTWTKGKTYTIEERKQRSRKLKGKNNHNWQGGKTKESFNIRHSLEYRLWRTSVFERDEYKCQICEQVGGRLEAHHIKSFAHYPKLRFDLNNGVTLCKECHKLTDNYGNKKT